MFLALVLNIALAQGSTSPEPVLIWVENDLPEDKLQRRAAKLTGSQAPWTYTGADLSFPPHAWSEEDEDAYEQLGRAMERGRDRWDEFDVELAIAQEITGAMEDISIVRDDKDRDQVQWAYLMLGAAVDMAFSVEEFSESEDTVAFRIELPGLVANRALLQVLTLDAERLFTVAEVNAGVAYEDLETLREVFPTLAEGTLEVGELPSGATLVIDGRDLDNVDQVLSSGHHWVHLMVNEVIRGRAQVDIAPGQTIELPRLVDGIELGQADRKVIEGTLDDLPEDVVTAVDAIASTHMGSEVFLATLNDEGRVVVVPYSEGAELVKNKPVTVAIGAELGGGAVATESFYYSDPANNPAGQLITAPAASGSFDLEVGIYNLALLAGVEMHITPTQYLLFGVEGQSSSDENRSTPLYVKAHGGVGLYALRPTRYKRPTLLLAGTYGWFSPGHLGYGARLTLGLPTSPKNWFRISFHGYYGTQVIEPPSGSAGAYPDHPLLAGGLRIGFQTAF